MKKASVLLSIAVIAVLVSACGGGGGGEVEVPIEDEWGIIECMGLSSCFK